MHNILILKRLVCAFARRIEWRSLERRHRVIGVSSAAVVVRQYEIERVVTAGSHGDVMNGVRRGKNLRQPGARTKTGNQRQDDRQGDHEPSASYEPEAVHRWHTL